MSTETAPSDASPARHVLLLCAFFALAVFGCWALWRQFTGGWDTQWSYMDLFHDPEGPTGPLPPELNHAQNIVHAFGFGLAVVMGVIGALYQYAAMRVACSRQH